MIEIITTWLSGAAVLLVAIAIAAMTGTESNEPTGKQPDLEAIDLERADDDLVELLESESDDSSETGGESDA